MRKNRMMRLASVLLVCVLLTTSVISGTFAKYVTTGEATDSARVAHWGVVVDATSDLFAEAYDKDESTFTLDTQTVISNGTGTITDVVAPGTTKEDASVITVTGTPEVATRITYTAEVTLEGWIAENGTFYCPLVFTLTNNEDTVFAKIDGANYNSADDLVKAIEEAVAGQSGEYFPNTVLGNQPKTQMQLDWAWPFEVNEARNEKDTYLGNQAAEGNASTITVDLGITVEQVD